MILILLLWFGGKVKNWQPSNHFQFSEKSQRQKYNCAE